MRWAFSRTNNVFSSSQRKNMARKKGSTDAQPRQRRRQTKEGKEKKVKEKQGLAQRKSQEAKASFLSALTAPEALLPQDLEVEDATWVEDDNLSTAADPSEEFIEETSGIKWRGIMPDALSETLWARCFELHI
jgi:hypothetical protein